MKKESLVTNPSTALYRTLRNETFFGAPVSPAAFGPDASPDAVDAVKALRDALDGLATGHIVSEGVYETFREETPVFIYSMSRQISEKKTCHALLAEYPQAWYSDYIVTDNDDTETVAGFCRDFLAGIDGVITLSASVGSLVSYFPEFTPEPTPKRRNKTARKIFGGIIAANLREALTDTSSASSLTSLPSAICTPPQSTGRGPGGQWELTLKRH